MSVLKALVAGVLTAALALPLVYALQWASFRACQGLGISVDLQANVKLLLEGSLPVRAFLALIAVVVAPVVEETFFRGILFPCFRDAGFRWMAFVATSVVFGLTHFNVVAFVPLTVFGALLAFVYERTGSLVAPLTAHAVFNLAPFAMVALGWNLEPTGH